MRRAAPLALLLLLTPILAASPQEVGEKVDKILARIEENRGASLADDVRELDLLGRAAVEDVRAALKRPDPYVRIAASRILYKNDGRDEAVEALTRVISGRDAAGKRVAADTLSSLLGSDSSLDDRERDRAVDSLIARAREVDDDLARIHLWRAVWHLTESIQPKREVKDLYQRASRKEVKQEAALALAEMESFLQGAEELKELAKEPGERGRLARAYLKIKELQDDVNRLQLRSAVRENRRDYSLLDEILDTLGTNYYDEKKIDEAKLLEAAARGICSALDPYTAYYDEKMIQQLREEDLAGKYGGIGARVGMQRDKQGNTWLTITEPIFSGPAYRAGLRSNDQIVEVDGHPTVNRELEDLVSVLRGLPGTKVKFRAYRRGWEKPREFEISREQIQLETTMHRMLPGQIGYLRLTTFGDQDIDGVRDSVRALRQEGMKALIFDLRGNSGGYLRVVSKLAGFFLEPGRLIVSTRGRGAEQDRYLTTEQPITPVPMAVLIDGQSASASEILAGALKCHDRALLIGSRTFGKGSVQDLKYLKTTSGNTAVRVTIRKWHLPDGQSVESDDPKTPGGVEPNLKVELPERDYWKDAEFERLRSGDDLDEYLNARFAEHRDLFTRLADTDGGDASKYPDFDALYEKLKTKASKDDVRDLLRQYVRRRVQDAQGKPLYFDFQDDIVLRRGIVEAAGKAGIDVKSIPEYSSLAAAQANQ